MIPNGDDPATSDADAPMTLKADDSTTINSNALAIRENDVATSDVDVVLGEHRAVARDVSYIVIVATKH